MLSNLVNGRAQVSSETAIRLARAFGSATETRIRLQTAYDIARALEREDGIEAERCEPQPAWGEVAENAPIWPLRGDSSPKGRNRGSPPPPR